MTKKSNFFRKNRRSRGNKDPNSDIVPPGKSGKKRWQIKYSKKEISRKYPEELLIEFVRDVESQRGDGTSLRLAM
jgi:hypothetical protein